MIPGCVYLLPFDLTGEISHFDWFLLVKSPLASNHWSNNGADWGASLCWKIWEICIVFLSTSMMSFCLNKRIQEAFFGILVPFKKLVTKSIQKYQKWRVHQTYVVLDFQLGSPPLPGPCDFAIQAFAWLPPAQRLRDTWNMRKRHRSTCTKFLQDPVDPTWDGPCIIWQVLQ